MTTKIVKKFRDLTDEEIDKLCDKQFKKYRTCFECPLKVGDNACLKILDLDRAIEVEVNDESK